MYEQLTKENKAWVDEVYAKIDAKLSKVALRSRNKIPYTTKDGVHDNRTSEDGYGITWWTNGFWGGLMWLMYEATGNDVYRLTAKRSEKLLDKAFTQFDFLHHDVGFMWHILSGASYRLTGNKESRNRELIAASLLASRYNLSGGFIRAWNGDKVGWTIIDCLMNIPLLYFASEETDDSRFRQIAIKHADMAMRDHVRPDGSTVHICVHDPDTGELLQTLGGQGCFDGSCWSRGLGWGIYGFILSYIHSGKVEYLNTAKCLANYYIANAAARDYLPPVDFRQPSDKELYDSTAAAICACGLIEIARNVPENEQALYLDAALKSLKAIEQWCDYSTDTDALLLMGTGSYTKEIHIPIIYGDYFYTEAILKLKGRKFLPW